MSQGLYIGSMGMITHMQRLNVHANNIANAQTTGFKADFMTVKSLDTHELYRDDNTGRTRIGSVDYAVTPASVHAKLQPGSMQITNSPTDFFLEDETGSGVTSFFVVEQDGQSYLTRDGHFDINEEGYLKTDNGAFVLDANGSRIQAPANAKLGVDPQGRLYDTVTNQTIGVLQTRSVDAAAAASLTKHENSNFTLPGTDIAALPRGAARIHNYMLENSNVDMTKEMAEMMTNQRAVQASQRIMTSFDKLYDKESNEIAR